LPANKLKVAILGSGNIGSDLLSKIMRSALLECTLFVGRSLSSRGVARAAAMGVPVSDKGVDAIAENPDVCDLVVDATSALSHVKHAPILERLGKLVVDLTPSSLGQMCVPAVNLEDGLTHSNVNMVTCGGQATVPIARVIGQVHGTVPYIEVVSQIASRSAGPATRINLDEYIENTERAVRFFSGCEHSKAILNLNPALPPVDMQATVFAKTDKPDIEALGPAIGAMIEKIREYVPGYQLIVPPTIENGRIVIMVRVQGLGDYLPSYAGNLDIINCGAIAVAEGHARLALAREGGE
jgi:acetaldehyde dehydrogenase (acetylating)